MKIVRHYNWNRRDFTADILCESCGHKDTVSAYDDEHYYNNVIPDMQCQACGKTGRQYHAENPGPVEVMQPRYDPNAVM